MLTLALILCASMAWGGDYLVVYRTWEAKDISLKKGTTTKKKVVEETETTYRWVEQ